MARIAIALLLFPLQDHDFDSARRKFPPEVTRALLHGDLPAPKGFDEAIAKEIGEKRLEALRKGGEVSGRENDLAAVVLVRLGVKPESLKVDRPRNDGPSGEVTVRRTGAKYKVAGGKPSGFFRTGQNADIALSAIDFNNAGGPLLFNHPMGIASDGRRLLLADTYNNRVLVWTSLPSGNTPPDLVLGQRDFAGNDAGSGLDRMNFPVNVATDGTRVVVADTENDRLLVWKSFPTANGQPADYAIGGSDGRGLRQSKNRFQWPWGVWTDGTKLAVSSTRGGYVLIWNSFPAADAPADLLLTGGGKMGTPRTITSDGRCLIVGDHNSRVSGRGGTFVWKTWPTKDDQPHDYHLSHGMWLRGCFLSDGRLAMLSETLHIWKGLPGSADVKPELSIRKFHFRGGGHVGAVEAGGRLYICTGNWNKIVVYNSAPTTDSKPDFAIGAPDLETDTLQTNFIISNPVPKSNGRSLFVASDFDRKLYVWKELPDQSNAHPDFVYSMPQGCWDIALHKETLAMTGGQSVYVWKKLPLDGEQPDLVLRGRIGSLKLSELRGIALDDRFFYLSDHKAGKVYVWEGIPTEASEPKFAFDVPGAARLTSSGGVLAVCGLMEHSVRLYKVDGLSADSKPARVGHGDGGMMFNGAPSAQVANGHLFVADVAWSRVHVWKSVDDAIAGKRADVVLGAKDFEDRKPEVKRDGLHYPAAVCFDGAYLWVGETKFSERLLRYSLQQN